MEKKEQKDGMDIFDQSQSIEILRCLALTSTGE